MAGELGTIVVVEDDADIADLIALYLRRDGYRVVHAADGAAALRAWEREQPRLLIVDVGLPGDLDGLGVCRTIRGTSAVPVIILTARGEEIDRVLGLELGADDYVTKPFSPRELAARVKAVLRRTGGGTAAAPALRRAGGVEVDCRRHEARVDGEVVALTAREFGLLAYLAANPGLVLSRRQLLDGVWGPAWYGDERTVDVHVAQLRRKLGDALPLTTVWGVGYRLD